MLSKSNASRFGVMLVCIVGIFAALIGRMAYLQLYKGDYYFRQAEGNRMRYTRIMAPRGIIYDRNGEELVNNKPVYVVSLMRIGTPYDESMLKKLSTILQMPLKQIQEKIAKGNDSYEPVRIMSNLTPQLVTKIEENMRELPGVMLEVQPVRIYVNDELAVHVLGYVGEISEYEIANGVFKGMKAGNIVGKFGVENYYDKDLRGVDGSFREEVDVSGRVVEIMGQKDPVPGKGLVLTLDANMQRAAEQACEEQLNYLQKSGTAPNAKGCAVVVMDPRNGEIRALVSRPAFNPNWFVNGISEKNWQSINTNHFDPMSDKAISGEYPPGSTFKIVTGSAALQMRKVTPDELINDTGRHWLVDMRNSGGEALGWINFRTALAASDNVYFYEMGNRIGIEALGKYAENFGFGALTNIDLNGESKGLVPSPEYKMKVFDEDWFLGDTFNAAIGQGFTLATPLQLACMVSAVATDGNRYRPHLVKKILNDDGSVYKSFAPEPLGTLPVSKENLALIQKGLTSVTQEGGTASSLSTLPISVAGKTGTSENPHGKDHGLFVAYAPIEKPTLVVVCIVEQGGYGSVAAVPIVRQILEYAFTK